MKIFNRLGCILAAAVMIGLGSMSVAIGDDVQVHQFGAVNYLDDSGFYGVGDALVTNPQPMPDDPATVLKYTEPMIYAAIHAGGLFCLNFMPDPPDGGGGAEDEGGDSGGDGGGDSGGGDPPAGDPPSEFRCT